MRSLGLDMGDKRTGVAISDPGGILATPLTVLRAKDEEALVDEVLKLAERYEAGRIVVGLPSRLDGEEGAQAAKATAFVDRLSGRAKQGELGQLDIQLWDERLSTRAAQGVRMEAAGRVSKVSGRGGRGDRRRHSPVKAEVDAIAAALILQGFLDSRRPEEQPGP